MEQGDGAMAGENAGLWDRVKAAFGGDEPAPPRPARPVARKPRKTAFDKVASERREKLALKVGEKVERVIVEKMETHEEALGRVAELARDVRKESVTSAEKLSVLRDVHRELTSHGAQRERVIESLARIAEGLEACALAEQEARAEERLRSRHEVERLERALDRVAARVEDRAEGQARLERVLAVLATGLGEQGEVVRDVARAQASSAEAFRDLRRALLATFEETQERTLETVRELDRDHRAELERRTRRATLSGIASGAVLALGAAFAFVGLTRPEPVPPPVAVAAPAAPPPRRIVATTLPASYRVRPVADVAPVATHVSSEVREHAVTACSFSFSFSSSAVPETKERRPEGDRGRRSFFRVFPGSRGVSPLFSRVTLISEKLSFLLSGRGGLSASPAPGGRGRSCRRPC